MLLSLLYRGTLACAPFRATAAKDYDFDVNSALHIHAAISFLSQNFILSFTISRADIFSISLCRCYSRRFILTLLLIFQAAIRTTGRNENQGDFCFLYAISFDKMIYKIFNNYSYWYYFLICLMFSQVLQMGILWLMKINYSYASSLFTIPANLIAFLTIYFLVAARFMLVIFEYHASY